MLQVDVVASGEYLYKTGGVCRTLYIIASGVAETVVYDPQAKEITVSVMVLLKKAEARCLNNEMNFYSPVSPSGPGCP